MAETNIAPFFEKFIREVSEGKGYRTHKNPALIFTRKAKSGEYDAISDADYEDSLNATEILSSFFLDKPDARSTDVLRVILEDTDLGESQIKEIAKIMASCYTPRLDEDHIHPSTGSGSNAGYSRIENTWDDSAASKSKKTNYSAPGLVKNAGQVVKTPRSIYDYLCDTIYGQDAAKRAAAMLLANHISGKKRNMVFAGPTGCGKTEIWRSLSKVYPHIRIVDSSRLTSEGWKGTYKIQDLFAGLEPEVAGKMIFVLDEADKFFEPRYTSSGDNTSHAMQNELLKLMEGDMFNYKPDDRTSVQIDTSGISFVFCGSFEQMVSAIDEESAQASKSIGFGRSNEDAEEEESGYERSFSPMDLVTYAGVRQEIAGRIDEIIQLMPMTEEDYTQILENEKMSPIRRLERQYRISLHVSEAYREELAREAAESKMGVRYLTSRLRTRLDDYLFDNWKAKEITLE